VTGPDTRFTLSSDQVSVVIAPRLGSRVLELTDLDRGRQWMWRNWHVAAREQAVGADYDANWIGGFDELFPNDAAISYAGHDLPDHGEAWSAAWEVSYADSASIDLELTTPVTGHHIKKHISVDGRAVRIGYTLRSGTRRQLPYLFKLHPALSVHGECTIDLPGGWVEKVDAEFGDMVEASESFAWPGRGIVDLDHCRSGSGVSHEFVYVSELPAGWCGITDHQVGASIRINYSRHFFQYCWLFLSYGGWQGHQVAVLEPCTTYPKDLAAAAEQGTTPILQPGEQVDTEIEVLIGPA